MFDEEYVRRAAQALGLEIAPEQLPGVLDNLRRMVEIAQPALAIETGIDDELAPVWRP